MLQLTDNPGKRVNNFELGSGNNAVSVDRLQICFEKLDVRLSRGRRTFDRWQSGFSTVRDSGRPRLKIGGELRLAVRYRELY